MKPAERDTENTQAASETNFITPEGGSESLRGSDQSRSLCASVSSSGKWGHNSTYFFLRTNLSNMLRTVPASKKALCTWFYRNQYGTWGGPSPDRGAEEPRDVSGLSSSVGMGPGGGMGMAFP